MKTKLSGDNCKSAYPSSVLANVTSDHGVKTLSPETGSFNLALGGIVHFLTSGRDS